VKFPTPIIGVRQVSRAALKYEDVEV